MYQFVNDEEYENLFIYHKYKLLDYIKDTGIEKGASFEIKLRATSIGEVHQQQEQINMQQLLYLDHVDCHMEFKIQHILVYHCYQ